MPHPVSPPLPPSPQFSFHSNGIDVVKAFGSQVNNRTFLVTGPSASSIGAETAISLAHGGPSALFLASRSAAKVAPVIKQIQKISPGTRCEFVQLDLGSQKSVRAAAEQIKDRLGNGVKLDVVINNAAVMAIEKFEKTEDGVEKQFGTNHLGHFLLTNLLVPAGVKRVVNVTSTAYESFGDGKFSPEDVNFHNGSTYGPWPGYGKAKTASILFGLGLRRHYSSIGLNAFAAHPGVIGGTNLASGVRTFGEAWQLAVQRGKETGRPFTSEDGKSMQQGCATTLVAALDPQLNNSQAAMLRDCRVYDDIMPWAVDQNNADTLWQTSEMLVKERFN